MDALTAAAAVMVMDIDDNAGEDSAWCLARVAFQANFKKKCEYRV